MITTTENIMFHELQAISLSVSAIVKRSGFSRKLLSKYLEQGLYAS